MQKKLLRTKKRVIKSRMSESQCFYIENRSVQVRAAVVSLSTCVWLKWPFEQRANIRSCKAQVLRKKQKKNMKEKPSFLLVFVDNLRLVIGQLNCVCSH
jgi:hypothetical protein